MDKTFARVVTVVGVAGFVVAAVLFIQLRRTAPKAKLTIPPHLRKGYQEGQAGIERLRTLDELRKLLKEAPAEGIKKLEAFAAGNPNTREAAEAHMLLAKALAEQGKVPEALTHIPPAMAGPGGPRRASRARLLRARLLATSDPAAARRDLDAVLADDLHPDLQLEARLQSGLLQLAAGKFTDAIATLAYLTTRNFPQKQEALEAIRKAVEGQLESLAQKGDPHAVLTWGDRMVERFPGLPGLRDVVRFHQAVALRKLGQFAGARDLLGKLAARKEALGPEFDIAAELARVAKAEAAAGIVRTREAFLAARGRGKERRRSFEGEIASDTRWSPAQGPIVLVGEVVVKAGATLTLEAGLAVQFLTDSRLVVEGALVAKGTKGKPVVFTSAATKAPSPFDGHGVVIAKSSGARSTLEGCTFEFQRVGLTSEGASPLIRDCTFRRNGEAGLLVKGGSPRLEGVNLFAANDASGIRAEEADVVIRRCIVARNGGDGVALAGKSEPRVENCRIRENGRDGIACDNFASPVIVACEIAANRGDGVSCDRFAQAKVRQSIIRDNAGAGVRCLRNSDPELTGNLITGNRDYPIVLDRSNGLIKGNLVVRNRPYGINLAAAASPRIEANWLEGNGGCEITCAKASAPLITHNAIINPKRVISNTGTADVQARENYFGTSDEKKLQAMIFDQSDAKGVGRVLWRPFLDEPPKRPPEPKPELPPLPPDLGPGGAHRPERRQG